MPMQRPEEKASVTICSLWMLPLGVEYRSYKPGGYEMPYRESLDEPYALLTVEGRLDRYKILAFPAGQGEDVWREMWRSAEVIATDLIAKHENRGMAIIDGDKPTAVELKALEAAFLKTCAKLRADGDLEWTRTRNATKITGPQRMAAQVLAEPREWGAAPTDMVRCEGCGRSVWNKAATCPNCNAVLDREKAIRLGMVEGPERGETKPRAPRKAAAG